MQAIQITDGRTSLWQWDTGVRVKVYGCTDVDQIHFVTPGGIISRELVDGECGVPDTALQMDGLLKMYAFDRKANGGVTRCDFMLLVKARPKPADYIDPPDEYDNLEELAKRVAPLIPGGGAGVEVDTTLTESGKAADAKATGDRLATLSKEIVKQNKTMNDYMLGVLNCLEHVAWSTPDGQQYYDALKAKYDSYNGLEPDLPVQPGVLTARSNSLSVDDASFKNGFVKNDGSIDTTTDYQKNFFWDKFVRCKAFLFVDENGEYVPAAHRYAAYRENKSIITTEYFDAVTTLTATSLLESDGAFFKVGFKQDSLTVDRALIANTEMDTLCTIEDTTLDTSGEAAYFEGRVASDYIQLYDNTPILCIRPHIDMFIVCLYDADKTLIYREIGVTGEPDAEIIAVPENAKYVRVCTTAEANVYTSLEMM